MGTSPHMMGSLFPSSFEQSLDCLKYLGWAEVPNTRFIEVVFEKATGQPRLEEGLLHEQNIKAWLDKDFGHEVDSIRAGGLRIVLLEDFAEDGMWIGLSLPKETLRSILQHFSLSLPYLSTRPGRAARSATFESRNYDGHRLLSFVTRDDIPTGQTHALTLTHNLQTSVTSSIMIGHPPYLKHFVTYVKERRDLIRNPSFLVNVINQIDINSAEIAYHFVGVQSADVEAKTGHGASFVHQILGDPKQLDIPSVTKSVHALASTIANMESRVKNYLLRFERLAEFEKKLQDACSTKDSLDWEENVQEMTQHAQWQVDVLRSMLYVYENQAKAAASQMSIIYSLISQRDSELNVEVARDSKSIAAASKRDSSAMKSIALLTMLFLPATFVSVQYHCQEVYHCPEVWEKSADNKTSRQTLFAMPVFDWGADRASAVVTRHAWIYLAVTLPLTVLVLSVWLGWIFASERMHRSTDEKARASVFEKV